MEQTSNVTPAQSAPTTPSTTVAAKTQAKKALEPASEAEFKNEFRSKVQEARSTPGMLLVPKMGMQGPTEAKVRVASRFLLEKVEWIDTDGTTKLQAGLVTPSSRDAVLHGSVATSFLRFSRSSSLGRHKRPWAEAQRPFPRRVQFPGRVAEIEDECMSSTACEGEVGGGDRTF